MTEFIIAFLIALIVGLGVGGGGFFVIYLTLCLNYPQLLAQGTNLLFFLICSVASLFVHARKRKLLSRELLPITAISLVGTLIGSYLTGQVDPWLPRLILGCLLTVSGAITLIRIIRESRKEKNKNL